MSFCCGASMIGTTGTLKHFRTKIHNVPLLFCPVCHRIKVHHMIEQEYELLAEYAHSDGADEVDFDDFTDRLEPELLYQNCVNHEEEEPLTVVTRQIDMALDLLAVAKQLKDMDWENQLVARLRILSERNRKLRNKKASGK